MINRRALLFGSAAMAASAQAQSEQMVRTAMIGVGNRGSYLLQGVLAQPDAKVLALCDIKPDRLDKAATAAAKDNPATYSGLAQDHRSQGHGRRLHRHSARPPF